jgi:hypothetical protein
MRKVKYIKKEVSVSYHDLIWRDAVVIVVVEQASIFARRLLGLGVLGGLLLVPAALEVQVTHFHQRDQTGRPLQLPVDLARCVPVARAFAALIAFGRPRLQANTNGFFPASTFDTALVDERASHEESPDRPDGEKEREEKIVLYVRGLLCFSMRRPDAFQFGPRTRMHLAADDAADT